MRSKNINTNIVKDSWFLSLPMEEQRFFLQILITPNSETSGMFFYPDREMLFDMPYFNLERIDLMKKRLSSDNKVHFYNGWVWVVNWHKNNYFEAITQLIGIIKQLSDIKRRNPDVYKYFISKGMKTMQDFQDYLAIKRRNKLKKEIRKAKPNLFGQALDREVDRVMGVSHSPQMDWASVSAMSTPPSQYPTPESVIPHIEEVANEFNIKQWALWWQFKKKVNKLEASGRDRHDYMALLKQIAMTPKKLSYEEKILAYQLFGKEIIGEDMPRDKVITIIEKYKL